MEMVLFKQGSNEWNWMWEQLAAHPINKGLSEPTVAENNGQTWQYMGSFSNPMGLIIHEFRHRMHPIDNERHYYKLIASPNIIAEDIEKTLPIK